MTEAEAKADPAIREIAELATSSKAREFVKRLHGQWGFNENEIAIILRTAKAAKLI